jgi:hypothetical protein
VSHAKERNQAQKSKVVFFSVIWAVVMIAFPATLGAIVAASKADAISSRLIDAASSLSLAIPSIYLQGQEDFSEGDIALKGIDRNGVRTCLFYMPLAAIPLPMIITGVDSINTGWVANSVSEQLYDSAKQRTFTLLGWRREFWMVMTL